YIGVTGEGEKLYKSRRWSVNSGLVSRSILYFYGVPWVSTEAVVEQRRFALLSSSGEFHRKPLPAAKNRYTNKYTQIGAFGRSVFGWSYLHRQKYISST